MSSPPDTFRAWYRDNRGKKSKEVGPCLLHWLFTKSRGPGDRHEKVTFVRSEFFQISRPHP